MIRSTITMLTLVALLLHASLGCCWHHAHVRGMECAGHDSSEEAAPGSQATACKYDLHGHTPHDRSMVVGSPVDQRQGEQPLPASCEEGNCSYLISQTVKVPTPDQVGADGYDLSLLPALAATPLSHCTHFGGHARGLSSDSLETFSILDQTQVCLL